MYYNRRRKRRLTKGEKFALITYKSFMAIMLVVVGVGIGVKISEHIPKDVETYNNMEYEEEIVEATPSPIPTLSSSPSPTPSPTPTVTPTPSPSPSPSPSPTLTPTPTPDPDNFWGCEHKCDEEGRYYDIALDPGYQVYIHNLCEKIGVPFELAISTCYVESRYDNSDYNKNDDGTIDVGLFQINEDNWEWFRSIFGESWDPYDPYDSIDAGLYYIQYCMEFDKDPRVFMMVYNMGPTGARKHWNKGTWSSEYSRALYKYMTEELPNLKVIED